MIITADGFKPIPIGFGFMLPGIGGLPASIARSMKMRFRQACGPTREFRAGAERLIRNASSI